MAVRSHILNQSGLHQRKQLLASYLKFCPRLEKSSASDARFGETICESSPPQEWLSSSAVRKPVLKWTGICSSKRSLDCHATAGAGGGGGGGGGGAGGVAMATVLPTVGVNVALPLGSVEEVPSVSSCEVAVPSWMKRQLCEPAMPSSK
eukprot:3430966-Prymnesium_polylepis.1